MKIVIVTKSQEPTAGISRMSHEIISRMEKDSDLDVVVCVEKGSGKDNEVILSGKKTIWNLIRDGLRVRSIARDADVVHTFDVWPYGLIGYIAVLFRKTRFMMSGIGTYTLAPLDSKKIGWLARILYARAESIPTISRYVSDELIKRLPSVSAPVVYLGTTPMHALDQETYDVFEEKYQLAGKHPILLSVGAVKDRKGQYDTTIAMKSIANTYPDATYCIVGSAPESDEYVQNIKKCARDNNLDVRIITDAKDDDALKYFYAASDIFVLASNNGHGHIEGFGLVFLEANQYGVPGIGTRNCGIEDAVSDGKSGVLVNQRAPEEIAQAVDTIMNQYEQYSEGAKKWHPHFSWDTTVEKYIELYKA